MRGRVQRLSGRHSKTLDNVDNRLGILASWRTRRTLTEHEGAEQPEWRHVERVLVLLPMPAVETELYDILGISPNATEDEIKKAYRKKAREQHPDKNINDPEASQKFQELGAAYETLSDPQLRAVYDEAGIDGLKSGGGMPGMDDLFAQFFAGGGMRFGFDFGGPSSRRRGTGDDTVVPHPVTLEDLYNGKTLKLNLEKEAVCGICKGTGAKGSAKPKQCVTCAGRGWTPSKTSQGTYLATTRITCHECDGVGEKLKEKDRCKKCKGTKTVKEKNRQEVVIEPGMADKQRIVLAGAGDEEPGLPPGDVIFVLRMSPHPSFERSGSDLLASVKITLSEALFGFSRILVTHLDGRGIKVTSPPKKIIRHHDTIVLRGEGMPVHKQPNSKGDLYLTFEIEMPEDAWLNTVDEKAPLSMLPPKKADMDPLPEVVSTAAFVEADIEEFGEDEDDWEDDEDDDDDDDEFGPAEPECRPQ
ncbi:DNAj-like protein subfamily a member 2-like protein [Mycena kentingensis (nom. inval.)]|nr:DNAj-like protein subfamily a member 2-like protein [Mycena kentingensis (nom. inval.)]